ncbi:AmmeMemoRadiSam system protein B [Candidatus Gracilibacteria bacterium]|nr:MAG: AmmeMemoRadiSam system protein B [Candidatus Gracilibacteria bacterium]
MKKIIPLLFVFLLASCGNLQQSDQSPQKFFAIIPHHNLANKSIQEFYTHISKHAPDIKNIIIISPNHFGQEDMVSFPETGSFCYEKSCISGFRLPFASKQKNTIFIKKGKVWNTHEHGIGNHFPFIKKYFPSARTSVLLFKIDTKLRKKHKQIIKELETYKLDGDTLFIASVDASHHTQEKMAYFHDLNTLQMLESPKNTAVEVDCPNCLFVLKTLARNTQKPFFHLYNRTSVDSILGVNSNFENTSHLYGTFEKEKDESGKLAFLSHFKKRKLEKKYNNISFTLTPKITNPHSLQCFYSHKDPKRNPKYWHNRLLYSMQKNFTPKSDAVEVGLGSDLGFTFFDESEKENLAKQFLAIILKTPMKQKNSIFIGNIENAVLYYDELFYEVDENGAIDCESFN